MPLEGLPEVVRGCPRGVLDGPGVVQEGSWGGPGGFLEGCEDMLNLGGVENASWSRLGALLNPSRTCLGASWAVHGPSWGPLEPCCGLLEPFCGRLKPSWGHRKRF